MKIDKLKELYIRHKELILYVFFGGLTTLCNFITYFVFAKLLLIHEIPSTIIAFVISVIFAFFTNRKYVFESNSKGCSQITNELIKFFGSRLFSGAIDLLIMYAFVTILLFNDIIIKLISNVLVIILNYIFSKLFVFKKK